jgi:hypothetical protein
MAEPAPPGELGDLDAGHAAAEGVDAPADPGPSQPSGIVGVLLHTEPALSVSETERELGLSTGPIDPAEYLARFASELDIGQAVEQRAREFAQQARERGIDNGRNPRGVAAGCLYAATRAANETLTQQEIAAVADVTPVTLRTTYTALDSEERQDDSATQQTA